MSDEKTDSQSGEQDTRRSAEPESGSAEKPVQSRDDLSASKTQPMPSQPRSFVPPDKASEAVPTEKTAPAAARSAVTPTAAAKAAGTDTVIHKKRAVAENAAEGADP